MPLERQCVKESSDLSPSQLFTLILTGDFVGLENYANFLR
jgi:hypothetical protein